MKAKRAKKNTSQSCSVKADSMRQQHSDKQQSLAFFSSLWTQVFQLRWVVFLCLMFGILGLLAVWSIHSFTGMPFDALTRDMAAVCRKKAYIGFLSNIGIIIWAGASSISFLTALFIHQNSSNRRVAWFFLCSGILTLQLVLDDALLLHERFCPYTLHLAQGWVYIIYIFLTLVVPAFFLSPDFEH